jgi:fatty-acid desaturase
MASAVAMRWGHGVGLADVLLAVTLYMVTGFGIAAGFHRLSRSFTVSSSLNFVNDHGAGIYSHRKKAAPSFMPPSGAAGTSRR